jgi:hypothetical protein
MRFKNCVQLAFACLCVGVIAVPTAHAQINRDNTTVMTFSQPVEIPGRVLPAGTYTFALDDSPMNRHIVRIYGRDGVSLIATVLAIPDYRSTPTSNTVVRFKEMSAGSPEAIRDWFFPGRTVGDEFVYTNTSTAAPPAATPNPTAPAVTPTTAATKPAVIVPKPAEPKAAPSAAVMPPAPPTSPAPSQTSAPKEATPPAAAPASHTTLPHTASDLPLLALLGAGLLMLGLVVRRTMPARSGR